MSCQFRDYQQTQSFTDTILYFNENELNEFTSSKIIIKTVLQ